MPGGPSTPWGSAIVAAEHLVAAAEAEDGAAAAVVGGDVDVEAGFAQGAEVGEGGLRAGEEDEGGVAGQGLAGADEDEVDVGLGLEGVEVVEVGDVRQDGDGDAEAAAGRGGGGAGEGEGVLGGEAAGGLEEGDEADRVPAGAGGDERHAVGEEGGVAAEAVDDEGFYQRGVGGVEDGAGADEAGDDAAAVDVADEDDGGGGGAGEAHVGDVVFAEVDLGGAAGAFDEEEVGFGLQPAEAVEDGGEEGGFQGLVGLGGGGGEDLSLDDDLGAGLGLRLEQDRIHVDGQGDAGGAGLQGLGAADLAAVGGDGGVVRHVLRLERADAEAAEGEGAGEAGDDQGFADVGTGALEHQGGGGVSLGGQGLTAIG